MGAGSCPAELDEVRALAVSESVRSFCINRNRSSAGTMSRRMVCAMW